MPFKKYWFLLSVVLLLLLYFSRAFFTNFFIDDFVFLEQSRVDSLNDIAQFFIPGKRFFRPVGTELLYAILYYPKSAFIGHVITFTVFLTGIFYLYKILRQLTKNIILSRLTILLYVVHFTHVFQLYWLATFQEVAMFTALSASFYFFLNSRFIFSTILFILALMSKEQSIVFPLFIILTMGMYDQLKTKKHHLYLLANIILSAIGFFIHKMTISNFTSSPEYAIQLSPKLMVNNWIWHLLWSLGFPSIMPDYYVSLLSAPLPQFWTYFQNPVSQIYIIVLLIYLFTITILAGLFITRKQNFPLIKIAFFSMIGFTIFLLPVLVIQHKWMVRLTLPLIFISLFQSYVIYYFIRSRGLLQKIGMILIALYLIWNLAGVKFHEETSTYNLETKITNNADRLFTENREEIVAKRIIYFADTTEDAMSEWNGSKKLQITFAGNSFLDYYFRDKNIKAIYGHETKTAPKNAFIIYPELLIQ